MSIKTFNVGLDLATFEKSMFDNGYTQITNGSNSNIFKKKEVDFIIKLPKRMMTLDELSCDGYFQFSNAIFDEHYPNRWLPKIIEISVFMFNDMYFYVSKNETLDEHDGYEADEASLVENLAKGVINNSEFSLSLLQHYNNDLQFTSCCSFIKHIVNKTQCSLDLESNTMRRNGQIVFTDPIA